MDCLLTLLLDEIGEREGRRGHPLPEVLSYAKPELGALGPCPDGAPVNGAFTDHIAALETQHDGCNSDPLLLDAVKRCSVAHV